MGQEPTKKKSRKTTNRAKGEGSWYKLGDRWFGEIKWTDELGVRHRKAFSGKYERVVRQKMKEFRETLANNAYTDERMLFREAAEKWYNDVKLPTLDKNGSGPQNLRDTLYLRTLPYIGDYEIRKITPAVAQDFINKIQKKYVHETVNKAKNAAKNVFNWYRKNARLNIANPFDDVVLDTNNKSKISDIVYYKAKERPKIIAEATRCYQNGTPVYRLGWGVVFLMYTGLRYGEAEALTWDDIDEERKLIDVHKSVSHQKIYDDEESITYKTVVKGTKTANSDRFVPITAQAAEALSHLRELNGQYQHVFASKAGTSAVERGSFDKTLHTIERNAGVIKKKRHGAHALRHTFASLLYANGLDTKMISDILGHADPAITQKLYIHLEKEQKAAAMSKLDQFNDLHLQ